MLAESDPCFLLHHLDADGSSLVSVTQTTVVGGARGVIYDHISFVGSWGVGAYPIQQWANRRVQRGLVASSFQG